MQSDDTRPLCQCGCGMAAKPGHRFLTGSHLGSRFTHEERFWLDVARTGDDGCWQWLGMPDEKGYGRFMVNGRKVRAHRFSWALHYGPIPEGMDVCHRCDNPPCVRPGHLFLGTAADNMHDAAVKGRMSRAGAGASQVRGERNRAAKLTEDNVREIRRLLAAGHTLREIAARFGVSKGPITGIARGKIWTHVQ